MNAPVFIMSPLYRSGSTALQRVFNAHPGVTIWGETRWPGYFWHGLKWNSIGDGTRARFESGERNLWTAVMCPERSKLVKGAAEFLMATHVTTGVWGIKMVRSGIEVVQLLDEMFPDARYVFLARDPIDTITSLLSSRWNLEEYERDVEWLAFTWRNRVRDFNEYAAHNPTRAYFLDYVRMSDMRKLEEAFAVTGIPFQPSLAANALAERIGESVKEPLSEDQVRRINEIIPPVGF